MTKDTELKVGTSVVVKPGIQDPDLGTDIGGWQGRIVEVRKEDGCICLAWDSVTLKNMPSSVIDKCEEGGLGWNLMYLEATDVEIMTPRDTEKEVVETIKQLEQQHRWSWLGKAGKFIQAVLANVDENDEWEAFKAWETYLRKVLKFPFVAEITEFQERGPLRGVDKVTVQGILEIVDLYGVIVKVKHQRGTYDFPLCDLTAVDRASSNYDFTDAYAVWFANR